MRGTEVVSDPWVARGDPGVQRVQVWNSTVAFFGAH